MIAEALFAHFPKMTVKRFKEGVAAFGSADAFFDADTYVIKEKLPWDEETKNLFLMWREDIDPKRIKKILEQEHITVITEQDEQYPPLLKQIYDPPFCLFVRGKLQLKNQYPIAVVGTRKASAYGKQ